MFFFALLLTVIEALWLLRQPRPGNVWWMRISSGHCCFCRWSFVVVVVVVVVVFFF
jgi:hypothetical protein